ncbi:MAG TPA: hypothetical protein VNO31_38600 [Umezawaea sp.]|nr:hypothetical protein [Umezawaea sp.]
MLKIMYALSTAVTALIGIAAPGTALAVDYETDYAVAGSLPNEFLTCDTPERGVEVCYDVSGDRWWVRDNSSDGKSAVVDWENYRGGVLYREGRCVNSHGEGTWASCDKNYYEDSTLWGREGVWNRSTGASPDYYDWMRYQ